MTQAFPPQDLECLDPADCPVAFNSISEITHRGDIPSITVKSSRSWFRVYDAQDGHNQPNPGYGDTRFAPFDSITGNNRIPTMYLAETLSAALLETSFHDIHANDERTLDEQTLHGKLHARLTPPRDLELVDFRDSQLRKLELSRSGIASSSPEHYPCTRKVAQVLHAAGFDGILWHSRQVELTVMGRAEAAVVFCDRVPHVRGSWNLTRPRNSYGSLLEGTGRLVLDEVAEFLNVSVVPNDAHGD